MEAIGSWNEFYAWNKRWKKTSNLERKEQDMAKEQINGKNKIDMFNWGPCVVRMKISKSLE